MLTKTDFILMDACVHDCVIREKIKGKNKKVVAKMEKLLAKLEIFINAKQVSSGAGNVILIYNQIKK